MLVMRGFDKNGGERVKLGGERFGIFDKGGNLINGRKVKGREEVGWREM